MKLSNIYSLFLAATLFVAGCDDVINPELPQANPVMVVDAWINNLPQDQVVKLTKSQSYFDSSQPEGLSGAVVTITSENESYTFTEQSAGIYVWAPAEGETFGTIDNTYTLNITFDGQQYSATTPMNAVPALDSVTFRYEEETFIFPESYFGEFWSRDLEGNGDTYWIKAFKNGELLNKPDELNIAYDAGFSKGSGLDNLIFIPPIRDGVNPFEEDENDEFLSPYVDGDSLYVEIHSISEPAFEFLFNVQVQTNRPGGFGELFAQPLANVPTNIVSPNGATLQAQGFFNVAAVSFNGKKLDVSKAPKTP